MDNKEQGFYTVRGYNLLRQTELTASMEDYLEMIFRLADNDGYTRISDLAKALNVQPPSASKMVKKLAKMDFLKYRKYGIIQLSEKGYKLGVYLLKRHETIERFLQIIGVTENILEETEKIEHNVSEETMGQIMILVDFLNSHREILNLLRKFQNKRT